MTGAFTLAHLSDVHLAPLPRLALRYLNPKRALGWLNWQKNRRRVHLRATLERIVADLKAQSPDHIAVTGDLANIGLPAEYEAALTWLQALGAPDRVTVVPGNHDIYSSLGADPGVGRWRSFMQGDPGDAAAISVGACQFPFVRRRPPVALIGVNSAIPTPLFNAGGRLGSAQREALAAVLTGLAGEGLVRVVLIHHPPLAALASPSKALEDAAELGALIAERGAELVLHGHNHVRMLNRVPRPGGGEVAVVGVPSASLGRPHKGDMLARYHLYRFAPGSPGQAIEVISRGLLEADGPVVEIERFQLGGTRAGRIGAGRPSDEHSFRSIVGRITKNFASGVTRS